MENKKEILSYWVRHEKGNRKFFKWTWSMIWILIKYQIFWRMNISFTVIKAIDREEYHVQFFAE